MIRITSRFNEHYKQWLYALRSRGRKQTGLFLIEGQRELLRAMAASVEIVAFVLNDTALQSEGIRNRFETVLDQSETYALPDTLFQALSVREHPDGVLGVAKIPASMAQPLPLKSDGLYVLSDQLEKPGNLGALLRSAEAVAVDGFFIADPQVDVWNPNVIRASQGAVFSVPIYRESAAFLLQKFQSIPLQLLAATPHAEHIYWDCDLSKGTVILIGNEARGLQPLWLQSTTTVQIPMYGQSADSLNAAIAGSLLLYEAKRQRLRRAV